MGYKSVKKTDDFETAFFKLLIDAIEPGLEKLQGTILYDYPPSQAALAKIEKGVAKRFEFYIGRTELCNAFLEETNKESNIKRLITTNKKRRNLGKNFLYDTKNFFYALEQGLPDCCGNALGFDRWLTVLLGCDSIEKIIPFREEIYRDS